MNVEDYPIDKLRPHARNYRSHPDGQIAHLQTSLREYGWARNVVIARDGTILAGHGIVEAARREGHTSVPVLRLDLPPDDPKAEKFLALENEVSRLAEDDDTQLAALLADVQRTAGLDGTGWDDGGLDSLIGQLQAQEFLNSTPPEKLPDIDGYDVPPTSCRVIIQFMNADDQAAFCSSIGIEYDPGRIRYNYEETVFGTGSEGAP